MGDEASVSGWLRGVIAELVGLGIAVRRDEPDSVHRARTMTRRLRVVLRVVPGDAAKEARKRLREYGALLGAARDLEVRAALAEKLIAELGADGDTDAARERLVHSVRRDYAAAHRQIVAYLDGPDYRRLNRLLDEAAAEAESVDELAVLHEARKSARALRYFAEAYGDTEKAQAGAALQDTLGDHRDHVLLARSLAGEDDAVLARLRETAQSRADALVRKA